MNIAFDIDGVVLDIDLGLIRSIDHEHRPEIKDELWHFYYAKRDLQLNPNDFMHDGDKLFLITGRNIEFTKETVGWKERYFPTATLVMLDQNIPEAEEGVEEWFINQARMKAKALKKYDIDIYFEDTPAVVKELRKLVDIPIIQYGGRFDY